MNNIDLTFDRQHIWHPYTSMTQPLPCYGVDSANGVRLQLDNGQSVIDGMSSWWSTVHGYNHPNLNQAITDQLAKMAHVMFGGLTHQPAISLCKKLVAITPVGLECVFLADSGSVAVEVALKMARQYWHAKGEYRTRFLALRHAYHGDTFGAMSICDPDNSMHSLYKGYLPENLFVDAPQCRFDEPWNPNDIQPLAKTLAQHHKDIAALVLEPIVQGAGGMRLYHPEYLRQAHALCQKYNVLLIADEIATGFGRTGKLFACEHADITPDILCLGKALTGGYMTLSATLTTRHIANTISEGEAKCFMHGPTFMGNPLACAVANASLDLLTDSQTLEKIQQIERQLQQQLLPLKQHKQVKDARVLGAIGVIETYHTINLVNIQRYFVEMGVWIRPFGKLIYIMPPYIIQPDELTELTAAIEKVLDKDIFAIKSNS